ncbi:MAG TPA: polyribonucleotide nucleotidyltransferase [Candidatus Rifleibacterium sp.]|nr:polyribonucleotide nucleotidyltransferase [Candidatus Rifleibacterium sp.]HPT47519.1 polyribonucleotide nucleotidyltransferase [Candidatus Rifleibacterium sp.]
MQKIEIVACDLQSQTVAFETGALAGQASGAAVVRCGDSVVFAAVVASKEPKEGTDFLPLTVDYSEKTYAAGKIPGGFFKREGRATTKEILTCRLIDRPIRPMFPEHYHNDIQLAIYVLSYDKVNQVDILAINAASAALMVSEVPLVDAIAGVRVGKVDGKLILNPSPAQLENSTIEMVVAGTAQAITMVESGSKEVAEDELIEALGFAHDNIKKLAAAQIELAKKAGKPKNAVPTPAAEPEVEALINTLLPLVKDALSTAEKIERVEKFRVLDQKLKETLIEKLGEETATKKKDAAKRLLEGAIYTEMRRMILEDSRRIDGRTLSEVRPINCAVGFLPRTHGSALFNRGQTQSLGIVTLGASGDSQVIDGLDDEYKKKFLLHYNFPPFSTGETKPMRGPGRREIGHGALAERALKQVIPTDFPYTIRVVSEIMSSNGSSSMASVCSGSLSLMDAGVPIKAPVAGIAMGLIKEGDNFKILSDILGDEDHFGDMDFKVAGTSHGVNALQMDIKIIGVTLDIMRVALKQAKEGRLHILGKMNEVIQTHRPELSEYAPRIVTIEIDPEKIRNVIGPGGKMIRKITEETGVEIEASDDGKILIISPDAAANEKAVFMIRQVTEDAEIGKIYIGKVKRIMNFGAFVEILPGIEGMVHISQLENRRVNKVEDVVNVGDEVKVKVIEIDSQGRVNLSRKAAMEDSPEE